MGKATGQFHLHWLVQVFGVSCGPHSSDIKDKREELGKKTVDIARTPTFWNSRGSTLVLPDWVLN